VSFIGRLNGAWRALAGPVQGNLERGSGPITQGELAAALGAMPSAAGPVVSDTTAMSVSTVYSCVSLLAGSVASLPLPVYRRATDGQRESADHAYWWLLNERPNEDMSAAVFWEFLLSSYLLEGNAFCEIVRRRAGRQGVLTSEAVELRPIHPDRVIIRDTTEFGRVFDVFEYGARERPRTVLAADMLHVPCIMLDQDMRRGMSPVRAAGRNAIGIALAAEMWTSAFFANGARPDFALKTDARLNKEQVDTLRTTLETRHQGAGAAFRPMVLTHGLDIKELALNAEDQQLIQIRQFQVEDVCRIYGVPPFMVGHTDKTTSFGAGVENMGRGFLKFTLQRTLEKFEQELNHKFWPTRERFFVEFNRAGLEQGDTKSKNESYRMALGRAGEPGWMSINEIRRLENLPPIDGGDDINQGTPNAQPSATAAA
jgi:HK97 family phage portal protein